jgi:UDP-glucose 4-epimerase
LVTGGAGFVGSHLVDELLGLGHSVVVLDNLSAGRRERVSSKAQLVVGSVTDSELVWQLFKEHRFERVFHLAAFAAEAVSHLVRRFNYETNVMGSVNLIDAAIEAKVSFFCFASSVAVYGDGQVPMRESDTPQASDSYGIAKLTIERELAVAYRLQQMPYTAFRMHNIYGEWQDMRDPYRNAVAIFLNQILRGEPVTVYGSGAQIRAFTYVGDIVPVIARAAETPAAFGKSINLGTSATSSVLELARQVCAAMGVKDHPISSLPARHEVQQAFTDTTLARSLFGDWRNTPLAEGIARTAAWAKKMGPVELRSSFEIKVPKSSLPSWAREVEQRLEPKR